MLQIAMGQGLSLGGGRQLRVVLLNLSPHAVPAAQTPSPPPVSLSWEAGGGHGVAEELADGMCSWR